ncbi:RNA polymerase-binding protein DksA [Poseidonibacter lekithochrous]|jgi:RNA polymerase-binding protein DksA|uniref:RNA polymerase-binding protein DksA n=1 Tax=Poseidonibacter TaxID=2321187 RepID=UPI001C0A5C42|nr:MULTISPECIES: RNA polymerase-binding protein DksA [Poseidonibacter]MBU3014511.1 RNA polymerase-binding protein DksA [Poseidonibacter lekithochrous]MDO6827809.1 RNA polymerase-binding protein DksA [Poseidonibacter sp. 1_MG-2023]
MPNRQQISELKETLIQRQETILKNINGSRDNIDQLKDQDIKDDLDYAEVISDSFTEGMIANHQLAELKQIEEAIKKIEDGSYGTCSMCGITIPIGRLKAKPFAKFCTECREVFEKEQAKKH